MNKLSDEQFYHFQKIEIDLRGRFLRFSVNVEGVLIRSAILLNEEKFLETQIEEPLNFKELMFHKKIEKMEKLLAELHSDLLVKYAELFKELYRFKELRNKMAHDYFTWDAQKPTSVIIWSVVRDAKPQYHEPTEYS